MRLALTGLSIKWRITLISGLFLVLIISGLISFYLRQSVASEAAVEQRSEQPLMESATRRLEALGALQQNRIQRYFSDTIAYANAVATQVQFLQAQAKDRDFQPAELREDLVKQLRTSLAAWPELLSIYVVFEPNAFGNDAEFVGKADQGSNEAGRPSFYWGQETPGSLEFLTTAENELHNETPGPSGSPYNYWYTCPRQTRAACVLQPLAYKDEVTGTQTLVSSLSLPIIKDGQVIGVIGLDIRLNDLQTIAESANREVYEGAGHFSVVSSDGVIAGYSRDPKQITARIEHAEPADGVRISQLIKADQPASILTGGVLWVIRPFRPLPNEAPWGVVLDVPQSTLLAPVKALREEISAQRRADSIASIALGVLAALIGLLCIWLTARGVSRSVLNVAARLRDVARGEGDISRRLTYENTDELGELSAEFNAFLDKLQPIITQVNDAVLEIRDFTTSLSQQANESSQVSQSLNQLANHQQQLMSHFRV